MGREGRVVLVALIQSVVGADDEDFSPLDEASRKEAGEHADENLLEE
jgi:hypothetical protein